MLPSVHRIPTYKLVNDVETRWNSTLAMFERVVKLQKPLVATLAILRQKKHTLQTIEGEEFQVMKEVCNMFGPFEAVTRELSSEK